MRRALAAAAIIGSLWFLSACGGGGGGSTSSSATFTAPALNVLSITSADALPHGIQGRSYSTTFTATGGTGALQWRMQANPGSTAPDGLSLNSATGVLSGTLNFSGQANITVNVSDSIGITASKVFNIYSNLPLTAKSFAPPSQFIYSLVDLYTLQFAFSGGVPPLTYTVVSGPLPQGVHMNSSTGVFFGAALQAGSFPVTVQAQDSYSPPETAVLPFTLTVNQLPVSVANSLPTRVFVNRPFSGQVIVNGGTPPFTFSIPWGTLPPGLSPPDPSSGQVSGTPTTAGTYNFDVQVTDSSSPPATANNDFTINVVQPLGRNDSIATATAISDGFVSASISPYEDPPTASAYPGDQDYYKVVAQGGQVVHFSTTAMQFNPGNPLDTVIEVVDANNNRLSICRQPNDTSSNFTSSCINDDKGGTPYVQDSAIDVQAPGPANTTTTLYLHVFDWTGGARPDMTYSLQVGGTLKPLQLAYVSNTLEFYVGETNKTATFTALDGAAPYTWTIVSGSLPPGLTFTANGVLSGTPTTVGTYPITVQVADAASETVQKQFTLTVADVLAITTPDGSIPDATAGTPYSYQFTSSGGLAPYQWYYWIGSSEVPNESAGLLQYTPTQAGAFALKVSLGDESGQTVSKTFSWTIHPATSLTLTPSAISASVGYYISGGVAASYGTPPYTFSVIAGSLPPGVTLRADGSLFGVPTTKGSYPITVQAVDSSSPQVSGTVSFTITVN